MCIKFEVTLPTVETFMFCMTLRVGCIIILVWTIFRSLFCVLFFIAAMLEAVVKRNLPCGPILVHTTKPIEESSVLPVYFSYLALIFAEGTLLIYTWYLARGLYKHRSKPFVNYLIWRFVTWVAEVVFLVLLCIYHKLLIGWYLAFLFFVILEAYSFIIVYSFYCLLTEEEETCQPRKTSDSSMEIDSEECPPCP